MKKQEQRTASDASTQEALTRRNFLATTAVVGAGLAVGTLPGAARAEQPNTTAGRIGMNTMGDRNPATTLETRRLGALEVSAVGFGCIEVAGMYNVPLERQEAIRVIRAAYDRGCPCSPNVWVATSSSAGARRTDPRSHRIAG
jgi:hypothetical protein